MKNTLRELLLSLIARAQPTILELAQSTLRRYIGIGKEIWNGLQQQIARLDEDLTLTSGQKHNAAVVWLRNALVLPEQDMPDFYMKADFEGRVVQTAVLFRRLQNWLAPEAAL